MNNYIYILYEYVGIFMCIHIQIYCIFTYLNEYL